MDKINPIERHVYRIFSRNLTIAVWNGKTFVGIREKCGSRFLDSSEISWRVLEDLGPLPDHIGTWSFDFEKTDPSTGFLLQNEALFQYLDSLE